MIKGGLTNTRPAASCHELHLRTAPSSEPICQGGGGRLDLRQEQAQMIQPLQLRDPQLALWTVKLAKNTCCISSSRPNVL